MDATTPSEELSRVLDAESPTRAEAFRGDVLITGRWSHGDVDDRVLPMSTHVLITYYGASRPFKWQDGRRHVSGVKRPGLMTLIPRGHEARWLVTGDVEVSHVYLPDELLQRSASALGIESGKAQFEDRIAFEDPLAGRLLEVLSLESERPAAHNRMFVDQTLDLLCLHLVRAHMEGCAKDPALPRGALTPRQLRRVSEYARERLREAVTLDELAGVAELSRFHFCAAFRRSTGQTPLQWLTHLRMARARELLAEGELPILGVALEVGYQTASAFAAAFRKTQGVSPSDFRRSG